MDLSVIQSGIFGTNTYIIKVNSEAIIIDPGEGENEILDYLASNSLKCTHVLLTHGHFDHISSAARLQRLGAKVYIHKQDSLIINSNRNLADANGFKMQGFTPDVLVCDGERLKILNKTITVMHTPGHTEGSVCYIIDDIIFSGDTLFYLSVGRTDFPGGSARALQNSLQNKLFALPDNYKILSGHGQETELNFEKENNPYA